MMQRLLVHLCTVMCNFTKFLIFETDQTVYLWNSFSSDIVLSSNLMVSTLKSQLVTFSGTIMHVFQPIDLRFF